MKIFIFYICSKEGGGLGLPPCITAMMIIHRRINLTVNYTLRAGTLRSVISLTNVRGVYSERTEITSVIHLHRNGIFVDSTKGIHVF